MIDKFRCELGIFINWLRWCWIFKEIVSYNVGLVSLNKLNKEEFEFVENIVI